MGSLRDFFKPPRRMRRFRKKAIEVLFNAMERILTHDHPYKPGAVIEKLPKEDREVLGRLTSDELNKYRASKGEMTDWRKLQLSKLKTDFDKKMRK